MADGLNRVTLLGNLGADPDLRYTQGGEPVLNARIATTESWFDKEANERKERTEWHNIVIWGKRGEALAKILRKGSSVLIEGSLRTSSYEDREGTKRYKTEVIASDVILAGGKPPGDAASQTAPANGGRTSAAKPARAAPPPSDEPADDIPF